MKLTPAARGIKGIFPLIKKHAPQSITSLPALDALPKSTRLAIDATLLIQRLHFADDLHPSRHLLGFHRLIRQMRECSLIPIMVFDNFSQGARLPAKMRENEKRRMKRSTLSLRANIERLRGKRLEALAGVLKEWREMESGDRAKVAALLQVWKQDEESRQPRESTDTLFNLDDFDDAFSLDLNGMGSMTLEAVREPQSNIGLFEQQEQDSFLIDTLPREDIYPHMPNKTISTQSSDIWSSVREAESSTVLYMASKIHHLRRQYGTLLSSHKAEVLEVSSGESHNVPPETPTQTQMTLAEGGVYQRLQAGQADLRIDVGSLVGTSQAEAASLDSEPEVQETKEEGPDQDQDQLVALTTKNMLMQRSYTRSSTPLSKSIFESCATLCSLLKVPVLWTGDGSKTGGRPHEAEALASMLVRNNLADAVVSEDSDVLLYGVPLIRGIMGQKGLEYVDSTKARISLFPPPPIEATISQEEGEKISQKQMLDFALLCGTDFNRTVPGIGSITALKLIREYKSIDGIRLESLQRQRANRGEKATAAKVGKDKPRKAALKEMLFPLPDNLKWREYSKELNEARRVFENPPSLYWEAHKLRKQEEEDSIDYQSVSVFLRENGISPSQEGNSGSHSRVQSSKEQASSRSTTGFGESPFGDGKGSAATWQV